MNETLQTLRARRSIRAYEDREVPEDLLRQLLEAGMSAPSAVAKDPWHVIVVRDRARLAQIGEKLPNAPMLARAPLGLIVCGDIEAAHGNLLSYLLQDCSALIENILIAATAVGLGACWLGIHPREERIDHLREVFGLPPNIIPVSAIAVGFPAKTQPARTRYDETKIHRGEW